MVCWGILSLNAVGWLMCLMSALIRRHHSNSCSLRTLVYLLLMIWTFWKLQRASGSARSQMGFLFAPVPLGRIWEWNKKNILDLYPVSLWPLRWGCRSGVMSSGLVWSGFVLCLFTPVHARIDRSDRNTVLIHAVQLRREPHRLRNEPPFLLQFYICCPVYLGGPRPDRQLRSLFYLWRCAWVLHTKTG